MVRMAHSKIPLQDFGALAPDLGSEMAAVSGHPAVTGSELLARLRQQHHDHQAEHFRQVLWTAARSPDALVDIHLGPDLEWFEDLYWATRHNLTSKPKDSLSEER
jgi:hypothetical protein